MLAAVVAGCPWSLFEDSNQLSSKIIVLWDCDGPRGLQALFHEFVQEAGGEDTQLQLYDVRLRDLLHLPVLSEANWAFLSKHISLQGGEVFQWRVVRYSSDQSSKGQLVATGWLRVCHSSRVSAGICLPVVVGRDDSNIGQILKFVQENANGSVVFEGSYAQDTSKILSPDLSKLGSPALSMVEAARKEYLGIVLKFRFQLPTVGYSRKYKPFRLFECTSEGENQVCLSIEESGSSKDSWIPNFADFELWEKLREDLEQFILAYQPDAVELELGDLMPILFASDLKVVSSFNTGTLPKRNRWTTNLLRG